MMNPDPVWVTVEDEHSSVSSDRMIDKKQQDASGSEDDEGADSENSSYDCIEYMGGDIIESQEQKEKKEKNENENG
jgi:hypothetical protein